MLKSQKTQSGKKKREPSEKEISRQSKLEDLKVKCVKTYLWRLYAGLLTIAFVATLISFFLPGQHWRVGLHAIFKLLQISLPL